MGGFERYLESLAGSWEALAIGRSGAVVVRGDGFIASRHPNPVLNNAVVLRSSAVDTVRGLFGAGTPYAIWSRAEDASIAAHLQSQGFVRDITTRPMLCDLATADLAEETPSGVTVTHRAAGESGARQQVVVDADVDPGRVAELNGVPTELLQGVPGIRAFAAEDGASGLVLLPVGRDVNVSFVATRPAERRRGLARAVTRAALADARARRFSTASLQATPMAESMYLSLGFRPVGLWQEWVAG